MIAVILAAGRGGRLEGVAGARPKCLARVGDDTLIERQLRALHACGLDRIAIVAGHEADHVRRTAGSGVDILVNGRYASTNSLYSLWLARDLLWDGFVVLNCDVLFPTVLLSDLLTAGHEDALLYAPVTDPGAFTDEEMKVRVRRGLVVEIDKSIPADIADGENIGIARFGREGAALLVSLLTEIVASGGTREWLPRAFDAFARRRPLHAIDSRGLPWIEIDFPEDYWRACADVLPAIRAVEHGAREPESGRRDEAAGAAARRTIHHV